MDAFLKMDIFFAIAAVGFVVLGVLVAIALVYVIKLLRTLNEIAVTVEEEAVALKEDLDAARASVKRGGNSLLSFLGFAGKTSTRLIRKKRNSS